MRFLLILASLAAGLSASADVAVFSEADSYRYGAAYRHLTTQTPEDCAAICASDPDCLAWNFNPTSHGGGETCELKASAGHRADLPGRVSGLSPAHQQAMARIQPPQDPFAPKPGPDGRITASAAFGPARRPARPALLGGGAPARPATRPQGAGETNQPKPGEAIPSAQGRIVGRNGPSQSGSRSGRSSRAGATRDYYPDRERYEAPETQRRPSRMED